MNWASFFAGLAAGITIATVAGLLALVVGAFAAWRFSRAIERAGFDIHLKDPKVNQLGP